MNCKCIGFVFNPCKPETMDAIPAMVRSAAEKGYRCGIERASLDLFQGLDVAELESLQPELIVAAGGDGTILRAAALAREHGVPILGVNFGRIGFLSEINASDFENALEKIAAGDYSMDRRMLLEGALQNGSVYHCLNDFLLFRHAFDGIAHINININGLDAGSIFCDGLIISTPTGATGYSISAGGPVISPGLEVSIVTPICPHSLYARPIVCSADDELVFTMQSEGHFSVDGHLALEVSPGDVVRIHRAAQGVDFIRFFKRNLYSLIREKLT